MNEFKGNSSEQFQEETLRSLQKELRFTRYCCIFVIALLVVLIVGGILLVNKMTPVLTSIEQMQPAIEKMEQLDIDMLNQKIAQLDIDLLNQKIEQLDIEGLNQIVEDLDAKELSETLENINDATALLKEAGEGISDFSDSLSGSFSDLFGIGR